MLRGFIKYTTCTKGPHLRPCGHRSGQIEGMHAGVWVCGVIEIQRGEDRAMLFGLNIYTYHA